jgi:GNAT superfamily N-acetyltransferase
MAKVEDYISGKILKDAEATLRAIKTVELPLIGGYIGKKLLEKIEKFEPMQITVDEALGLIKNARKVAVGPRVCFALHNRDFAESVFLDELAEELVNAEKAEYTNKEDAINTLRRYSERNPVVASKVSGKYMEICCSSPRDCVYWNMERRGLRCLRKFKNDRNMKRAVKLREFKHEDLEAMKRLIYKTIEISYSDIYPEEAIEYFKDYHSEEHILSDARDGYTIVLECNGKIMGTGTLLGTNIRRVFVEPFYQHKGFGKSVMHKLEERALARGISILDLSASIVSKRFYDSLGYVTQKEDYIPVWNNQKLIYYEMAKKKD